MASSDVSSVTKYFATAAEGFNTTLGSTIVSGATSVPLNSTSGLTNGNVFVGIIEPGATAQQVFTGTVDVGGSQITNVVWTRGSNTGHAGGVTIVDYSTGTARNMTTTGILKQHTQAGAHTGITTDTMASTGNVTVGGTLGVTGATTLTGAVSGTGYDLKTIANSYKFSAYRNGALSTGGAGVMSTVVFDTKTFDTGTNFSTSTGLFTAPVAGYYLFSSTVHLQRTDQDTWFNMTLLKNGSAVGNTSLGIAHLIAPDTTCTMTKILSLAINDTVGIQVGTAVAGTLMIVGSSNTWFDGCLVSAT